MKIERKDFEAIAEGVCLIAQTMAVSAATYGLAFCGITTTMMSTAKKHPKIVQFVASIAAGAVTSVLTGTDGVKRAISDDSEWAAKSLSKMIYGPSEEEETIED